MIWDSRSALEAPGKHDEELTYTLFSPSYPYLSEWSITYFHRALHCWTNEPLERLRNGDKLKMLPTTTDYYGCENKLYLWVPDLIWLACCCSSEHGQYLHWGVKRKGKKCCHHNEHNFTLMKQHHMYQQQVAVWQMICKNWGFYNFPFCSLVLFSLRCWDKCVTIFIIPRRCILKYSCTLGGEGGRKMSVYILLNENHSLF